MAIRSTPLSTLPIKEFKPTCSLLSEIMAKFYGNQQAVSNYLNICRGTLRKLLYSGEDVLLVKIGHRWVAFTPTGWHNQVDIQALAKEYTLERPSTE